MRISDLERETDASVWVEAWMRAVEARPEIAFNRNAMRGWFGSAIEAGRAAGSATGAGVDAGLEEGVRRVIAAGLATGHADTWAALMDEVLDQYLEMRERERASAAIEHSRREAHESDVVRAARDWLKGGKS